MSRKGNCYGSAPMESFFGSVKNKKPAKRMIFEYIEVFYHRIWRHAKIGNQIPTDFANQY